jgi:two-component system response regulator HupR/HoxA
MVRPLPTVLLLDPDPDMRGAMEVALNGEFDCATATSTAEAAEAMKENFVQVVVAEAAMLGGKGTAFFNSARERWPETLWIVCSDAEHPAPVPESESILQVLKKPCSPEHFRLAVRNGTRLFQLARDNDRMALEMRVLTSGRETKLEGQRAILLKAHGFEDVLRIPGSPMIPIVEIARQYASFDVPVLITGEPGTGKRQLARAMHYASLRSDRPFYELNCAGLSDELIGIELFGARNGSVPNGHKTKMGLVQKADRGTLFLNGINLLSSRLQMMLLRLLTDRSFQPVGGHETIPTNVRLMCTAPPSLAQMVEDGDFSSDLYYAISVTEIALPPLRARTMDIPVIARRMLFDAAATHSKPVHGFTDPATTFLTAYDWPGNLRELQNEVTRMLIFAQERILGPELISRHILQAAPLREAEGRAEEAIMAGDGSLKDRVEHIEARILRETLTRHRWNKSRAAAELGLSRVGLRSKLERYGVLPPEEAHEMEED